MLLKDMRSVTTIQALKSIFARYGIPENVISDNGTQFSSQEYKKFAKMYIFKNIYSSPKYPRGDGVAEIGVE